MFHTIVVGFDGSEHAADAVALALQLREPAGRLILAAVEHGVGPRRGELDAADVPADVPVERRVITDDSPGPTLNALADAEGADLIVVGPTHRGRIGVATGRATVQHMLADAPCALAVAAEDQSGRGGLSRICVAHDGSAAADLAAEAAYGLAIETGAQVRLVRVVDPVIYTPFMPVPVDPASEEEERRRADAALAAVAARAPRHTAVERVVPFGPVAETVVTAAKDCDLLLMGCRHQHPPLRLLAGSVALHALTDGRVPVLVMPRPGVAGAGAATAA